ncbi:MAG TPA: hypothetical protein VG820_11165 [Fimbriimonadaceae bacterium]|nr:hypothetical protein [Fimbriimonadaceae bacterium]
MEAWQQFFVVMAALSASAQTVTEQLFKKRLTVQLGTPTVGKAEDRRQLIIHVISGVVGALLAYSVGLHPFKDLIPKDVAAPPIAQIPFLEYILVGILVSFGGGFFNDILSVMQTFTNAQKQLQTQLPAQAASAVGGGGAATGTSLLLAERDESEDPFDVSFFS